MRNIIFNKELLFKKRTIFLLLGITGLFIAVFEGLGLAIFIPLLQPSSVDISSTIPYPLNIMIEYSRKMGTVVRIQTVAVLFFGITILRLGFVSFANYLALQIRAFYMDWYKTALIKNYFQVNMSFYNKKRVADLHVFFDNHIETSIGTVVQILCNIVPPLLTAIFLIIFLLFYSWKITLASFGFIFTATFFLSIFFKIIRNQGADYVKAREKLNQIIFDALNGMKTMRLFIAENKILEDFKVRVHQMNKAYSKLSFSTMSVGPLFELMGVFVLVIILFMGSLILSVDAQKEEAVLATLLTFLLVIFRIVPQIKQLNHAKGAIISRIPAIQDLDKFFNSSLEQKMPSGDKVFNGLKNEIKFEDVTFSYDSSKGDILKKLNFCIKKGQRVGLVGPSGAGKSTIIELMMRFYDSREGCVLIDGTSITQYDISSLRSYIGVVAQEVFLFNDTIRNNIRFFRNEISDEAVEEACRFAYAEEFINNLPEGYETNIGDRGVFLSGGQKQRLAIARAILTKPDILIFDEATSSLDSESERMVQLALDNVSKQCTVIAIAHRLATVVNADKILVLDSGILLEEGTHDELIKNKGVYQKYVETQTI